MERLAKRLGQFLNALQQEAVLDDGDSDADDIAFLKGIGSDHRARNLTRDNHQRNRIHVRSRNACNRVGGTRTAGYQHDTHLASRTSIAIRFMNRGLLVTGKDVVDLLRIIKRVVDLDGLAARITKQLFDALSFEGSDDRLGTGKLHTLFGVLASQAIGSTGLGNGHRCFRLGGSISLLFAHDTYAPSSAELTSFSYFANTPWLCFKAGATQLALRCSSSSSGIFRLIMPPSMSTVMESPS